MKKEIRYLPLIDLEIQNPQQDGMQIQGYVVKFNQRSQLLAGEIYEKVHKGAFRQSLQENTIKALWNHRTDYVLGSTKNGTLQLEEDDIGLRFNLQLPNNNWGRDAYESIKRGDVDGVSFGFMTRKDDWKYFKEEDVYERTLLDVNLLEISPTPFPAYPDSEIGKRSWEEYQNGQEKEKLLITLDLLA